MLKPNCRIFCTFEENQQTVQELLSTFVHNTFLAVAPYLCEMPVDGLWTCCAHFDCHDTFTAQDSPWYTAALQSYMQTVELVHRSCLLAELPWLSRRKKQAETIIGLCKH